MKNVGLISSAMLLSIALSNNLSAGPVYAAKWVRDEQTVLMNGDYHATHETNEVLEREATVEFCKKLQSVTTKTLVLGEDTRIPLSAIFTEQELLQYYPGYNKMFLPTVHRYSNVITRNINRNVEAKCIEVRADLLAFVPMAFKYAKARNDYPYFAKNMVEKKAFEAIKNHKVSYLFDRRINRIREFARSACNENTAAIFSEIVGLLQARKRLLWSKMALYTNLSFNELNRLTIGMVAAQMAHDERYKMLVGFLSNKLLMLNFSAEFLDAEALWFIVGVQNPCQKIIVNAGAAHIHNIENYLFRLGFNLQEGALGQNYMPDLQKLRKGPSASHSKFPDPLDDFAKAMVSYEKKIAYKNEVDTARQQFMNFQWFDCPSVRQQQLQWDDSQLSLNYNNSNPISLIPLDAFNWINE